MQRCPACPGKNNCVPSDGPEAAAREIVFIGEAPGRDEDRKRTPFIGKTGDEVNRHYLPLAGLRRGNSYFTNCIRCLPDTPDGKLDLKTKAHQELLESCAGTFLYKDLERLQPKLIVPMGAFACHAIDPSIELELHHGKAVQTMYGTAFPMYHPSGGIHEPKKMMVIRTDWDRLRKHLKGKLKIAVDLHEGLEDYAHLTTAAEVDERLEGFWGMPLACDTETIKGGDPFCLTFSCQPGTGYLIKAEDRFVLEAFQAHLDCWKGPILFHNWLFDRRVVRAMNLAFPEKRIKDTMLKAFHLGNIPQGLKVLAYRELGIKMKDFDDVVTPYSKELVLQYYRYAQVEEWEKPPEQLKRDKDGKIKLYKPQGFGTKLKRFFTDYGKNNDKDVFKMWTDNWTELHEQVEAQLGPWPGKCISHAAEKNWPEVLAYACLAGDSLVDTPYGFLKIKDLVRNHYTGNVRTFNEKTNTIEERRVTGHYRNIHTAPIQWVSVTTEHTRLGKWGLLGTRYTPDHRVLSTDGYKQVIDLKPGDRIYIPQLRITPQEWQIVYGSILGDGGIGQRNNGGWACLRFSHNIKQREYYDWKVSLLSSLEGSTSTFEATEKLIDYRRARCGEHFQFTSRTHPELVSIRADSYQPGMTKNIGPWISALDSLALAVWYQDDGTLVNGKYARLYTLGFSKSDVDTIRRALWSIFEIDSACYETTRPGQWAISIPVRSSIRFYQLIAPFTHPVMQYKLPFEWRDKTVSLSRQPPTGLVESKVVAVSSNIPKRRGSKLISYCIDVEETHNFLTMGEVAHNCRDADATLRLWPLLKHMESRVRKTSQEHWQD